MLGKYMINIYATHLSEVLYQSRIHPGRTTQSLTDEEIGQLHYQLKHVCETACLANADPEQFPKDWIFHRRWKKGREALTMSDQTSKQCAGPVTLDGHPIVFETVSPYVRNSFFANNSSRSILAYIAWWKDKCYRACVTEITSNIVSYNIHLYRG
jgi:hypothetical protein